MEHIMEQLLTEGAIDTATEIHLSEQFQLSDVETQTEVLETLLDTGYLQLATTLSEQVQNLENPEMNYIRAEIAFLHGDMDGVILHTDNIGKESDIYVKALILEAEAYANLEMPDVSERKLKEMRHYLEDSSLADLFLAEFYYEQENYDAAYNLYAKLVDDKEHADKVDSAKFASLSYALGEYETALEYYEKVLHPEVMSELQMVEYSDLLLHVEKIDTAITVLEHYIAENTMYVPNARIRLGQLWIYKEQSDKAKAVIQQGLMHDAENAQLLLFDALLAKRENNMYRFEQQLYKILENNPQNVSALRELVNYKFTQEAYEDIEALIRQLETQGEYDVLFDWYKAKLESVRGHDTKALEEYAEVFDALKTNEQFLHEFAVLANELNDMEKLKQAVICAIENEMTLEHIELYKGVLSID